MQRSCCEAVAQWFLVHRRFSLVIFVLFANFTVRETKSQDPNPKNSRALY